MLIVFSFPYVKVRASKFLPCLDFPQNGLKTE